MSYLLDDKKILLKEFILKNQDLQDENEQIELENEIFLSLIEKYETKRKMLKTIQYIHYICTNLYKYENEINFNVNEKEFFNRLEKFLDSSIDMFREPFNYLVKKSKNKKEEKEIETKKERDEKREEENDREEEHTYSIYQNELILKNNLYDIDIEKSILNKKYKEKHGQLGTTKTLETESEIVNESLNESFNESFKESLKESKNGKNEKLKKTDHLSIDFCEKKTKDNVIGKTSSEFLENVEKIDSTSSINEKNICIKWDIEDPKDNFIITQFVKKMEDKNNTLLNMKEKQHLVLNEIEKLKNEIKKISLYFENTQIIINSIVCQNKIFLFELEEERKLYEIEKEKIKNDKNLKKKSTTINDFYNRIIEKQKKKIEDVKQTNETLLNLYKKKFENVTYLISINENINNVDFLYLNVLIYNKKLNYDKLMKDYERNYSYLRKMLNEINNSDKNIKENEQKRKKIKANILKNNELLNEMDESIITITNEIETIKNSSNKIGEEENIDTMNNRSILDCIQLNKDISAVEKKIKSYQRKIETLRNIKAKN